MGVNMIIQTEINKKENRLYPFKARPFHPNLTVSPLAGKFYARHDFADPSLADPVIEQAILKKKMMLPKDKFLEPATSNMDAAAGVRALGDLEVGHLAYVDDLILLGSTQRVFDKFDVVCAEVMYGWYLEARPERERFRFHYPKKSCWITEIGALIYTEDSKMPKKIFTGVPFKV